jgi:4-hydroxy-L-threonine phosphate dehydrogenase PdxA
MSARVRIVGDHPHRGESGTVRDEEPMRLGMWLIDLDGSSSGASGCFAGPKNLRPLPADEDPET